MRLFLRFILLLLPLAGSSGLLYAQTIDEKQKQADDLFEQGRFVEATKLYSEVIAQKPRDPDVNFKYGTCLLYNSHNKHEAIKYLQFACNSPTIDPRAYYYLGRAYHINYQFDQATKYYEIFKQKAPNNVQKELDVDAQLNACKYGKTLLADVTDMVVMKKTEIQSKDFYEIYDLSNIGGTILRTDEFQSKEDKKRDHRPLIHFPSVQKQSSKIFYSSYGEDGSTGLDIYMKSKLPDGTWSLPQKVIGQVNTFQDEDYPYMDPAGEYLYFSSKGHNSMGGYDVYRSKYNPADNSFGPPENLDFAISSPDDDIFYVVDSLGRLAYFTSARESQDGKLFVYEVRVQRIPIQQSFIKGNFVNNIGPGKEISIEIEDFSTGKKIGTFNSKSSNGDYFIILPKAGKYKFFITPKGSDETHYAIVDIPYSNELKPLKQRVTLNRDETGEQYVVIDNLFDEVFDDPDGIMAEIYQYLSQLPPNAEDLDLDSLDAVLENDKIFVDAGLDPFSTVDDVKHTIDEEISDIKDAIEEDKKNANIAYNKGKESSDLANEKMVELNQMFDRADKESDPVKKKAILDSAYVLKQEIEDLNNEAKDLIVLGNEIDQSIVKKEVILKEAEKIKTELNVLQDGDQAGLGNVVKNNNEFFADNVKKNEPYENVVDDHVSTGNKSAVQAQQVNEEIVNLNSNRNELVKKRDNLENKLGNTKKAKEKEAIQKEIDDLNGEIAVIDDQLDKKKKEYQVLTGSSGSNELTDVANVVNEQKNQTNPNYTADLSLSEKQNISANVKANNLDANLVQADKIFAENGITGSKVDLFATNETTSNYSLSDWNDAIDKEIISLENEKKDASDQRKKEIEYEIVELENLRNEKIKEFETVGPDHVVADVNSNQLVPNYDDRKNEINKITDPNQRAEENLLLNNQLKQEIIKEKNKLEQLKNENPDNNEIDKRIENLNILEDQIDNEIEKDKTYLAENGGSTGIDPEKILTSLDPDYQQKVNDIYLIADEGERNKQLNALNQSILEKSNERIQELDAILKNDPDNKDAQAEKDYLLGINDQIESNGNTPLVEPVTVDVNNISSKVEPGDFIDDYQSRKDAIDQIENEHDRRKAQNDLNRDLSNEVRNEIKQLEKLKETNPDNKDIDKRLKNLKKLDDELTSEIVSNENWMKSNPKTVDLADGSNQVKTVNPDYQNQINDINKIEDDGQKKEAIQQLNNETLEKIDQRVEELDQVLEQDPNNVNAQKEKEELKNLKNQITQNPDEALTEPTNLNTINTKVTADDLIPGYSSQMNNINASSNHTDQKEREKIDLNERLIGVIDGEIAMLEKLKEENPGDAKNIDKRISALNDLRKQKELEIENSKKNIGEPLVATIGVGDLLPNYNEQLNAINQSGNSVTQKEQDKIDLNNQLIVKIDNKISELEKLKLSNPDKAREYDQQISQLNNLKQQKEQEIINSQAVVDGTGRPVITIGDLMPDYQSQMDNVKQNSSLSESDKWNEENRLNNQLISRIDNKITELSNELTSNPDQTSAIQEDIQKLEELKEAKQQEIDSNTNLLASGGNNVKSVNDLTTNDFNSEEGQDVIKSHEGSIEEMNKLNDEISDLEQQRDNADSQKDKDKIDKKIDKKKYKLARVENEVIEDIGPVNQTEYQNGVADAEIDGAIQTAGNPDNPDIELANENMRQADQLMLEAQQLRDEASKEKDPVIANEKLNQALVNEQKAKELVDEADRIYKSAKVINNYNANKDEVVVTEVPDNSNDRKSTQLLTNADNLDVQAEKYSAEAAHLRDSAQTVKKKYKEAILNEANKLDEKANQLRNASDSIRAEGVKLKEQEDAILAAKPDETNEGLDPETTNDIRSTSEYEDYYSAMQNGDENMQKAVELDEQINELKNEKNRKIKQAVVNYTDGGNIQTALDKDASIQADQQKIDSLTALQKKFKEDALNYYESANNVLDKTDSQTRDNILAIGHDQEPIEKIVTPTFDPLAADFNAPDQLNGSIFRTTDGAVYSDGQPIPMNQNPSGLVYKVQVGAFRKPLPQDHFSKFAPISGEKLDNGITRFMVGYFKTFTDANGAKGQINGMGYGDAFVVAYCNGNKISIGEARRIESGEIECIGAAPVNNNTVANNTTNNNTTDNNTTNNNTTNNNTTNNNTTNNNTTTNGGNNVVVTPSNPDEEAAVSYYTSYENAAPANQVEIMKGLFFTVQIGAYRTPVSADVLKNISPLNSQKGADGLIRYSTGVYSSFDAANARKNQILPLIPDAFVVAYYNGERITIAEANRLLDEQGSSVLFNGATGVNTSSNNTNNTNNNNNTTDNTNNNNNNTTDNTNNNNNTTDNTNNNNNTTDNTNNNNNNTDNTNNTNTNNEGQPGDLYRVEVGYFEQEVPADFTILLLEHQDQGIVSESDFDENITYYTIPYTSKEEADRRQEELYSLGFTQANVKKMPEGVDEYGNKVEVPVEEKEVYYKDGVYYKIMIGKYEESIPGDYATILLQTEDMMDTEVDIDGNTYLMSTKLNSMNEVEQRLIEFNELGIEDMYIVSYYKYDPIPFEEADKIYKEEDIDEIHPFDTPQGILADDYLYNKDAIYFRVELGRFLEEVPSDFANLILEEQEVEILREETFDEEIIFFTENMFDYQEAETLRDILIGKGFKDSKIVAYHKYDEISVEKARKLLGQ